MTPVVALHYELVRSGHQGEAVAVVEGLRDVLAKGVASTPGRDAPATTVIRVRPQQVAHRALSEKYREEPQLSHGYREKKNTHLDKEEGVLLTGYACVLSAIPVSESFLISEV